MAGCRITQHTTLQIHKEISCGNEVLFEFAAQSAVQSGENARRIMGVGSLCSESDFQHGGDQGSRDAVSSDVRDQHAEVPFIDKEKIVEISGHGAHRSVACG